MQVELFNRRRGNTRLELANAIFEYLEIFHNRQTAALVARDAQPHRIRAPSRRPSRPRSSRLTAAKPGAHESLHRTRGGSVNSSADVCEHTL